MDTEQLRRSYQPREVRVLFVGESPPAGGTFFYAANSKLFFATREAFKVGVPERLTGDFLHDFRRLGCFLEDLCARPVNDLQPRDPRRLAARQQGESGLAQRTRGMPLQAVIVTMLAIDGNVASAMAAAGHGEIARAALPFPGRQQHKDRYIHELSAFLQFLDKEGIFAEQEEDGPLRGENG